MKFQNFQICGINHWEDEMEAVLRENLTYFCYITVPETWDIILEWRHTKTA